MESGPFLTSSIENDYNLLDQGGKENCVRGRRLGQEPPIQGASGLIENPAEPPHQAIPGL